MIEFRYPAAELKQAIERIKTLPLKVEKKILRRVLRKEAKPFAKMAQAKAPRSAGPDSGELARRIGVRAKKRSRKEFGVTVDVRMTGDKKSDISARDVEFGHHIGLQRRVVLGVGKKKKVIEGEVRSYVAPRPFMRPTFDTLKNSVRLQIANGINELVEEIASGKSGGDGENFDSVHPKKIRRVSSYTRKDGRVVAAYSRN